MFLRLHFLRHKRVNYEFIMRRHLEKGDVKKLERIIQVQSFSIQSLYL